MNYLITIVGPTGIGKTNLSIALAQKYQCEILSCDSRQFYKEMCIGTAVPTSEELAKVKHHFIHYKSIHEPYDVGQFEKDALLLLDQLFLKKNIAIMVGGSGLYVQAVIEGLDNFPKIPAEIRASLNQKYESEGLESLQALLNEKDPESYAQIAIENPRRIIRALEVCLASGKKYSSFKNKAKNLRNFTPIIIGITADRNEVYHRIDQRVDLMMVEGLEQEVEKLQPFKELNALQTVGYREIFNYLEGKCSLEFAISEIKKNSRRYAKRQFTWFKKMKNIHWVEHPVALKDVVKLIDSKMV